MMMNEPTHACDAPRPTLWSRVSSQFRRPRGLLGRVAGWIMHTRSSNRQRNAWTVGLLDLGPGMKVLEVGFGSGLALADCARRVGPTGRVVGLDHSEVMLAMARRHTAAIPGGASVELRFGGFEDIATSDQRYDRVLGINVIQFLGDLETAYRAAAGVLAPGGVVAFTYQPRHPGATRDDALDFARRMVVAASCAGLNRTDVAELALKPVPAVAVLARRG